MKVMKSSKRADFRFRVSRVPGFAFPINLSVCVEDLGTVYSELQYCITPSYSRCYLSICWRSQTENWSLPQSFFCCN